MKKRKRKILTVVSSVIVAFTVFWVVLYMPKEFTNINGGDYSAITNQ